MNEAQEKCPSTAQTISSELAGSATSAYLAVKELKRQVLRGSSIQLAQPELLVSMLMRVCCLVSV